MKNRLGLTLRITSILIIVCLIFDSFNKIDLAPTKNDHLIAEKKLEIDRKQNVEAVKDKAKEALDQIRNNFKETSDKAIINFCLLLVVLTGQIFSNKIRKPESSRF